MPPEVEIAERETSVMPIVEPVAEPKVEKKGLPRPDFEAGTTETPEQLQVWGFVETKLSHEVKFAAGNHHWRNPANGDVIILSADYVVIQYQRNHFEKGERITDRQKLIDWGLTKNPAFYSQDNREQWRTRNDNLFEFSWYPNSTEGIVR